MAEVRARRPPTADKTNAESVLLDEEEQEKTIAELMQRNERDARLARLVVASLSAASALAFAYMAFVHYSPPTLYVPQRWQIGLAHGCSCASMCTLVRFTITRARRDAALALLLTCGPLSVWAQILALNSSLLSAQALLPAWPVLIVVSGWQLEADSTRCAVAVEELRSFRYKFKKI